MSKQETEKKECDRAARQLLPSPLLSAAVRPNPNRCRNRTFERQKLAVRQRGYMIDRKLPASECKEAAHPAGGCVGFTDATTNQVLRCAGAPRCCLKREREFHTQTVNAERG